MYNGCYDNSIKSELKEQAERYKDLYRQGKVSQEEAMEMAQPYLNLLNCSIHKLAKAYNIYIKEQTFKDFMNYRY